MKTHEQRLQELLKRDNTHPEDMERRALFFVLSGNDDIYSKVNHIYDFEENSIKTECLDGEIAFSGSSKSLVKLAYNLYNQHPADVSDIFYALDKENAALAIEAIKLRFGI